MEENQPWQFFPMLPLFAFNDKKKAKRFISDKLNEDYEFDDAHGSCVLFEQDNDGFCIILINADRDKPAQRAGLLTHECVHYMQFVEDIFQTKFDRETAAYIVQAAFLSAVSQIGEKWFTATQHQTKRKTS